MDCQELLEALQKPALYVREPHRFWDDEHISKGMLEAHLDPMGEAASRAHSFMLRSALWICEQVPMGSSLLDLGCGPGLYAHGFYQCGMRVTGVDLSARSIAYARELSPQATFRQESYLELADENAYDIAVMIYGDYAALLPDERKEILRRTLRALRPGGLFLLDVFTPRSREVGKEERHWSYHAEGGFWSPRQHALIEARYWYNDRETVSRYVVIEEGGMRAYNIWDRLYEPEELEVELTEAGFMRPRLYGDVAGARYTQASHTVCMIVQKQPSTTLP